MLIFYTTSNKRLGRKFPSILERTITVSVLEKKLFEDKDLIDTDAVW